MRQEVVTYIFTIKSRVPNMKLTSTVLILIELLLNTSCRAFVQNNKGTISRSSTFIANKASITTIVGDNAKREDQKDDIDFPTKTDFPATQRIKGIIFDMDGTLVQPCIDFADMRSRIYEIADNDPNLQSSTDPSLDKRGDVLELYEYLSKEGQKKAKEVFRDIEEKSLKDMKLMEGLGKLCEFLDSNGIKRAVLTRNVGRSVDVMHDKLWNEHSVRDFHPAVNRETIDHYLLSSSEEEMKENSTPIPMKPAPDGILYICKVWGCSPQDVVMVGDCSVDDIVCACRAKCGASILLKYKGEEYDNDSGGGDTTTEKEERKPTITVSRLEELLNILESNNEESKID